VQEVGEPPLPPEESNPEWNAADRLPGGSWSLRR
jgi:hypothetical protein